MTRIRVVRELVNEFAELLASISENSSRIRKA